MKSDKQFIITIWILTALLLLVGCGESVAGTEAPPSIIPPTDKDEPALVTDTQEGLDLDQPTDTIEPTQVEPTDAVKPTQSPPTDTAVPKNLFSDEFIAVKLEKVVISDELPPDIEVPQNYELPEPDAGNNYVFVLLSVNRIEGVHLTNIAEYGDEKSSLVDKTSQEFDFSSWSFRGIQLTDPSDIRSTYEYVEGTEGFLVFEVPSNAAPSSLVLIYTYKLNLEEETEARGELEILLEG